MLAVDDANCPTASLDDSVFVIPRNENKMKSATFCFVICLVWHSLVKADEAECQNPLATIEQEWKFIHGVEKSNASRIARLVGFAEGHLGIRIRQWWRNDGFLRTQLLEEEAQLQGVAETDIAAYGTKTSDLVESSTDQIKFHAQVIKPFGLRIESRKPSGELIWANEIADIIEGVGIAGIAEVDCALAVADKFVFSYGRMGNVRFLIALSEKEGTKCGHFVFIEDNPTNLATSTFGAPK